MGRKSKVVLLTEQERKVLEAAYKTSDNHCFRQRCKMILLKSECYTSKEVAAIVSTTEVSVHNWLKRYEAAGIEGLRTKAGRGRKPILQEVHLAMVSAAVAAERQRLSQAQQIIEENLGRKMSRETLSRFLKVITAVTNE